MASQKLKAKYRTVGPRKETVTRTVAKKTEMGLEQAVVSSEEECYYVFFPQGHSIRLVGKAGIQELKRMGYDKRPRLIDMETGDVVDAGGDPYDFGVAENEQADAGSILIDDDDAEELEEPPIKGK